ncbi:immunoglobulin heavy chain secretory form [Solea senegalensis]|nr:immunoglobulin heavy chain secretory form [Solea senegalensis]
MVTVTSGTPSVPTVFPLMPCGSGTTETVTLGCLATGFTPSSLTFTWKKNGASLVDFIQYPPVQKGNGYTGVSQIRVSRADWNTGKRFQCAVSHSTGNKETGDIFKPKEFFNPPDVKVLAFPEQHTTSFLCLAENFSPKVHEIKWLQNNKEIVGNSVIKTHNDGVKIDNGTVYTATSILTVDANVVAEKTEVTCRFKGKGEKGDTNTDFVFQYNPEIPCVREGCTEADAEIHIEEPKLEDLFLRELGTLKCNVIINNPPIDTISWENENGKKLVTEKVDTNGKHKEISLPLDITLHEWSQGIKRFCVVERSDWSFPVKKPYERTTGEEMQRPSVFMMPPIEHTRAKTVTLTCYVKDFFPREVFVSWLADDVAVDSKYEYNTTLPVETNGSYSAYGQLSLSLDDWQKKPDMVYSCVVYHQSMVNNTKVIIRSIDQRISEKHNMVNLNMNIPCPTQ